MSWHEQSPISREDTHNGLIAKTHVRRQEEPGLYLMERRVYWPKKKGDPRGGAWGSGELH